MMYQIVFGDHTPGLPPELNGTLVRLLGRKRKPIAYGRCVTLDTGLIYNVPSECLQKVDDIIVLEDDIGLDNTDELTKILTNWGLDGTETATDLMGQYKKAELTDLLTDIFGEFDAPAENLKLRRTDTKSDIAHKITSVIGFVK